MIYITVKMDVKKLGKHFDVIAHTFGDKSGFLYTEFNEALKEARLKLSRRFAGMRAILSQVGQERENKQETLKTIGHTIWALAFMRAVAYGGPAEYKKGMGTMIARIAPLRQLFSPAFIVERKYDHPKYNNSWWNSPLGLVSKQIANVVPGMYFVWTFFEYGVRPHVAYAPAGKSLGGNLVRRYTGEQYKTGIAFNHPAHAGAFVFDEFFREETKLTGIFFVHIQLALKKIFGSDRVFAVSRD